MKIADITSWVYGPGGEVDPPYYRYVNFLGHWVLSHCLRDGVNGTHLAGEYLIERSSRNGLGYKAYSRLDLLTAQAIIYHIIKEESPNSSDPGIP